MKTQQDPGNAVHRLWGAIVYCQCFTVGLGGWGPTSARPQFIAAGGSLRSTPAAHMLSGDEGVAGSVTELVACVAPGDQPAGDPPPVSAATPRGTLWELSPLRVHCLVCVESDSAWSDERRQLLADAIVARCDAEFGPTWETTAAVATVDQTRAIQRAVDAAKLDDLESLAESDAECDKWMVLYVQTTDRCPTLVVWEFDVATRRWRDGPVREIGDWQQLAPVAFDSLAEVCSAQAWVKSVAAGRVILRLRGGLLPVRNSRRAAGAVGAIFQLTGQRMSTFARVERRDGHLLECRVLGWPVPDQTAADFIGTLAVEVRTLHASTHMAMLLDAGATRPPLVGCEVWISRQREDPGSFLGRTDASGCVPVDQNGGVVWLHLRRGPVLLESVPVVPGYCHRQRIATGVRPGTLQVAEALALCSDDLAELTALRSSIQARVTARTAAGQLEEAAALEQAGQAQLMQLVDALHPRWQARKAQAEQRAGAEMTDAAPAWKQLIGELNALRPASDTKTSE